MRLRRLITVLMFVTCAAAAQGQAPADEVSVRGRIEGESHIALRNGNIEKLESMSAEFRKNRTRTPSGIWQLTYFYKGIESAVAVNHRTDPTQGKAPLAAVDAWQQAYPDSPSAKLANGVVMAKRAWLIRGHGYADSVPESAWKPFREGLEAARVYLESVKSVASADPHWYCEMANIAKAQSWPPARFETFARELLDRHPYYYQAVLCTAEYWAPRWHYVDAKTIANFADRAVEKTRAEDGTSVFARIYWSISPDEVDTDVYGERLAAWPRVRQGFRDMIARYPEPWNLNKFAQLACLAGDRQEINDLARRIGNEPLGSIWGRSSDLYERCRAYMGSAR